MKGSTIAIVLLSVVSVALFARCRQQANRLYRAKLDIGNLKGAADAIAANPAAGVIALKNATANIQTDSYGADAKDTFI